MPKSKIYIRTKDGREVEILSESYIYLRDLEVNGTYWEWHKISSMHDEIKQIIQSTEESIDHIIMGLSKVAKEESFPHDHA